MAGTNTIRAMGAGLLIAACKEGDIPPPPVDSSLDTAIHTPAEELHLKLTACLTQADGSLSFAEQPITPQETLPIHLGEQGGCHVWVQLDLQGNQAFRGMVSGKELPIQISIQSENGLIAVQDPSGSPVYQHPEWTFIEEDRAVAKKMVYLMNGDQAAGLDFCRAQYADVQGPFTFSSSINNPHVENPEKPIDVYLKL